MEETPAFATRAWESFYVIVGSTAGALTGLQFVVLTLITEGGMLRGSGETLSAFGTPTVIHFCAALLLCAVMSAPWPGMGAPGVAVALVGAAGFLYSVVVLRRALRQRDYKPVLEDWIWHAAFPKLAYGALVLAGILLPRASSGALFVVDGSALLLVFIGIHNAWDTVTYVMVERAREQRARAQRMRASTGPPAPADAPSSGTPVEPAKPPPAPEP